MRHAAIEAGATAIGFNFYPQSPRYVTPEQRGANSRRRGRGGCGVFVNEAPARVEEIGAHRGARRGAAARRRDAGAVSGADWRVEGGSRDRGFDFAAV